MHDSLEYLNHRPWPIPSKNWRWRQSWLDLGFMHFRVSYEQLRKRIPYSLEIDQFDGSAWVSIVPFRMFDVMRGGFPSFYPFKSFPELNLRTYVKHGDKAGVWFFSLDATAFPVVLGGRYVYGMPYHLASISYSESIGYSQFNSKRLFSEGRFEVNFKSVGKEFLAEVGSFEHWVTERYCLYSKPWYRDVVRVEVHHKRWPMMNAEFEVRTNGILQSMGIEPISDDVITHYSRGVEVISYEPQGITSR